MPTPSLGWLTYSERSFSTRSGSWFQKLALEVAQQFHRSATLNYLVEGSLKPAAKAHIEEILATLNHGSREPSRESDLREVFTVQAEGGEPAVHRVDLQVMKDDGTQLFFEMKTPWPNKDTSISMKRMILTTMAIRKDRGDQAFASSAYNPYSADGRGQPYGWSYAMQFMELGTDFLVGRPFWEMIGDSATYDELLAIASAVGAELEASLPGTVE